LQASVLLCGALDGSVTVALGLLHHGPDAFRRITRLLKLEEGGVR
jgi:hypothetical protein